MRTEDIKDFKRDLKRIMDYYQIGLSIKINGDTHGIYGEEIMLYDMIKKKEIDIGYEGSVLLPDDIE